MVQCFDRFGWMHFKVQHTLAKFRCCKAIIFHGCCYSYSKTSQLNVKKLPTACFSEGKLRLLKWKGVIQDDFEDMLSTSSK